MPAPSPSASTASETASARRVRGVVLLTVDALRADQPWSGYPHAKTPHLSALAERSTVYTRAYTVANTTLPSLAALHFARYPTELPRDICPLPWLRGPDSLAEVLSRGDVATAAFHGHPIFSGATAPSWGFALWRTVRDVSGRRSSDGAVTGAEIAAMLDSHLRGLLPDRPFFAWAHFVDPHDSYVRHQEFPPSPSPIRGLYDGEVAYVDAQIGKVLRALSDTSLADSTAVIVTADHGEAFGEHERYRHGHTLHEEEIRVPLIVHLPGAKPRKITAPRSTLDLARTISALLAVEPSPLWRGVSLLGDADAEPAVRPVLVDAPMLTNLNAQRAMILGDEKLWLRPAGNVHYHLGRDPAERSPEWLRPPAPLLQQAQGLFAGLARVEPYPCRREASAGN